MAKIIAIGNQKGGCGKTTVTCLLANALSAPPFNLRVFVADCDAQQSIILRRLADQQQTDALPPYQVAYKSLAELQRDIERLDSEHDLVFIDLPGRLDIHQKADQQEITRYLLYVDFLFVPFTPGNYATASSVDYLRAVQKIAATKSGSPRPLTVCAFANMYEGGRTTDDRDLVDELDALRASLRIRVLDARLQRYALFRSVDTFTSFYDPIDPDRAIANFSAFLREISAVIIEDFDRRIDSIVVNEPEEFYNSWNDGWDAGITPGQDIRKATGSGNTKPDSDSKKKNDAGDGL